MLAANYYYKQQEEEEEEEEVTHEIADKNFQELLLKQRADIS